MKVTKIAVLIAVLFLNISQVFSQEIFREGYIVKHSGDTLNGMIGYSGASKIPQSIVFKRFDIAVPLTYSPNQIVAFGYKDANHFEARLVNGIRSFVECYVKGTISLFGHGNRLFIDKNGENFTELKPGVIKVYSTDGEKNYADYIEFIKDITSDKKGYEIPQNTALRRGSLVKAISKYNSLTGTESKEYNYTAKYDSKVLEQATMIDTEIRKHFGFSSSLSFSRYSIGVTNKNNVYGNVNIKGEMNSDWGFGAFYLRQLSRENKRLWLKADLLINSKQRLYQFNLYRTHPTENQIITIESSFVDVKIPIALQFTSQGFGFSPYFSTGLTLNLLVSSNNTGKLVYNSTATSGTYMLDDSKFRINRNLVNLFVSAGFKQKILNNTMFYVEAKGEIMITSHETQMKWTTNTYDYYEFQYFYGPKLEFTNPSPYFSLNFGIGF